MLGFISQFREGVRLPAFTQAQVKNEPCFFGASPEYARKMGGPITLAFLDAAGVFDGEYIFDSRVHMLMPGWFPCIPGWHHDDVPRTREDGQPNYESPSYRSQHVMATVGGEICSPEFAVGACEMPAIPLGQGPIYKHWHNEVERLIEDGTLRRVPCPANRLVFFDCDAFHQGTAATGSGFRWFGRLSWKTDRKPANEIRTQTQVYLPFPMEGW